MSDASASAILTLLTLVLAGPLYYALRYAYNRFNLPQPQPLVNEFQLTKSPLQENADEANETTAPCQEDEFAASEEKKQIVDHASYLLGLLGYAIGIGNVWRFPYLVGQYGGGAFVFAYIVCLFLVAMPLYLVELGLGQYTRMGAIASFTMIRPRWRSLGWAQVSMVAVLLAYYNVLLAYSCIYIIGSCVSPLPWKSKGSEFYWNNDVLNNFSEKGPMGDVQWKIAVSLLFVYMLVFFSVGFGKKVLTDITWVTVVGPVCLMIILFCRTVGLPGAEDGIEFYLGKFDWAELYNMQLWATACGQIIFSLSPGLGTAMALSSVTSPQEDVYRVCMLVGTCNSLFSLFGGFAVFSILGNLARETGRSVSDIASESGTGLAFITIADGITNFGSASNAMSILFFVMLLTLGLDSTFAMLESVVTAVDELCRAHKIKTNHTQIVGILCILLFLLGLPFCTRGGNSLLDVIDHFVGAYFLLFSCFLESLLFSFDFGWKRYVHVLERAIGRELYPAKFWKVCICYIVPVATIGLLLSAFVQDVFFEPFGSGDYTRELIAFGWVVFATLVCISIGTIWDKAPSTLPPEGCV